MLDRKPLRDGYKVKRGAGWEKRGEEIRNFKVVSSPRRSREYEEAMVIALPCDVAYKLARAIDHLKSMCSSTIWLQLLAHQKTRRVLSMKTRTTIPRPSAEEVQLPDPLARAARPLLLPSS